MMGDAIVAESGKKVEFKLATQPVTDAKARLLVDGKDVGALRCLPVAGRESTCMYDWASDGGRHWVRAELDDPKGEVMTLTNPIYVNWGVVSK